MNVIAITVEVKKMLSDGDYGHESVQVSYTAELEVGDDRRTVVADLLEQARADCVLHLRDSESITVRRKINAPRRVCNECHLELDDDIRSYLHPVCEEKVRAERDAARQRQQLVGVGASDDMEDPF